MALNTYERGEPLNSKHATEQYKDGWDRIWGNRNKSVQEDVPVESTQDSLPAMQEGSRRDKDLEQGHK